MIRLHQPVRAFFLIQMRPPARESLNFKASEPLQNSLHRILSLVSGFPSIEDLIQAHPFTPTRLTKGRGVKGGEISKRKAPPP